MVQVYVTLLRTGRLCCFSGLLLLLGLADVGAAKPRKYALLIGISSYQSVESLKWSARDSEEMRKLLLELGFAARDIRILKNEQATKEAMIREMLWLKSVAKKPDQAFFFFSGHGTVVPASDPKSVDGCDEALVPYDAVGEEGKVNVPERSSLLDNVWIRQWVSGFRTKNLLIVIDSCFSGGITGSRSFSTKGRGKAEDRPRFLPSNVSCRIAELEQEEQRMLLLPRKMPYIVFTASHPRQYSWENDGLRQGIFSALFIKSVRELKKRQGMRFRDLMKRMESHASKSVVYKKYLPTKQQPRLYGEPDVPLFFEQKRTSALFVSISLHQPGSDNQRKKFREKDHVEIRIRTNQKARIAICGQGTEGKRGQFFPNNYHKAYRLSSGKEYRFPPSSGSYQIEAYGPPGEALFWVVASTEQQPTCGEAPPEAKAALHRDTARGGFGIKPGRKRAASRANNPHQMIAWIWAFVTK